MSAGPLNPAALLATLSECGVDFVVIGALAVGVHGEVRGTGDVDVMVPVDDEANKKALHLALEQLGASRIPAVEGGVEHGSDADYPTIMFNTRFGRLDILYRPDGSAPYPRIKQRAITRSLGGHPVRVAGKDDMVSMKLAAGRPDDLRDVASMTASERGEPRRVVVRMTLAPGVDAEWARELADARATLFDSRSRVTVDSGHLQIEAVRHDLTDPQLEMWARAVAERLHGSGVLATTSADVRVRPR
jgi:hypothetical protein